MSKTVIKDKKNEGCKKSKITKKKDDVSLVCNFDDKTSSVSLKKQNIITFGRPSFLIIIDL